MITHTLNLELAKKIDSIGVPIVIRTMDNETQTVSANLFMHGQDYTPACDSARLDIMHEDGAWAHVDAQVSGNVVTATLPSKALGTGGAAMAYFAFIKGKQIETTESFALRMEKSAQATPESDRYFDASINRIYEKWKNFEAGAEHAEDLRKAAEVKRESDFAGAQTRHETAYTDAEQARTGKFNQAEEERTHAENARVSAESARADAEQARVSAESARNEQESSRAGAEQARQQAEGKRDSAEQTRTQAETARDGNEDARKQAETTRTQAEDARQQAEQARANNENARAAAERERTQAEQTRAGNEDTRKEQEQSRATQEGLRAQAETTRNEQESLRQAQEQARKDAEQARTGAEDTRKQAEDARAQAEQKRDLAEGTRAQAEALRVAEETKRKDAERTRATEEEGRKTRFTQMMDAAQNIKFKIVQADDNGTPLGAGVAGIIYLVRGKTDSATNEYTEWIWYEGRWELFGTSGATVEPITPQDIDTVAQDGTISGTRVLSATALNYLWEKLKAQYQTQAQVTAAVSAGTEPLAAKLQTLDTTKADKQETQTALDTLKKSVDTDIKQQLQTVNATLATKASTDSVRALDEKAATKDALAQLDANKADKSALETLKQDVGDGVKKKLQDVNATLATKADASALNSAKSELNQRINLKADASALATKADKQETQNALATKADKATTDTFASQATQQLKALREWAESTLQSKMQEKYNEGFSRGKQEGGGAEKVFTGELTPTQLDELYGKVKDNSHLVNLFIAGAHEKTLRALMQKLTPGQATKLMRDLDAENIGTLICKLTQEKTLAYWYMSSDFKGFTYPKNLSAILEKPRKGVRDPRMSSGYGGYTSLFNNDNDRIIVAYLSAEFFQKNEFGKYTPKCESSDGRVVVDGWDLTRCEGRPANGSMFIVFPRSNWEK